MRVSVITPYHSESRKFLETCVESVRNQTIPCRHYLVADGPASICQCTPEFDNTRHIVLGVPQKDYGNTPRGIGALLAVSEGADAVCFLDADNLYDPDHVETCVALAEKHPGADFIVALRRIVLPDGTPVPGADEPIDKHVDTSCFFLLPGAFHIIPQQVLQPKQLCTISDRLFLAALQGLRCIAMERPTVTYTSNWRAHYEAAGVDPPSDAKGTIYIDKLMGWWRGLTPMERAISLRRLGLKRLWGPS
jgi:Glycosyl transferase family 2